MPREFAIGLGSNLGDRAAFLARGVGRIAALPSVRALAVSRVYESAAIGPAQPDYLNAALRIACDLEPHALLDRLLAIEAEAGRIREVRWGPRVLDLDILWADQALHSERLTIPHPHLRERTFALAPLLDVAPELARAYASDLALRGGPPPRRGRLVLGANQLACEYHADDAATGM